MGPGLWALVRGSQAQQVDDGHSSFFRTDIEKVIPLGGIPEFPVSDPAGNVFVNIDDTSEIVQLDAKLLTIKAR
jgi:hypothetical protein